MLQVIEHSAVLYQDPIYQQCGSHSPLSQIRSLLLLLAAQPCVPRRLRSLERGASATKYSVFYREMAQDNEKSYRGERERENGDSAEQVHLSDRDTCVNGVD